MECAQHHDRLDRGKREFGGDVGCNAGEPQHMNIQTLSGCLCRFQVLPGEVLQTQHQRPAGDRFTDGLRVGRQLVSNRRADQIGPIRVKAFFDQQIDLAEVDRSEAALVREADVRNAQRIEPDDVASLCACINYVVDCLS